MADEERSGVTGGIRTGLGILTAFKEAIEETIEEARQRGDFSTERAKTLLQEATTRVQHTVDDARERLDFVPRREFDELRSEVDRLRARLAVLEGSLVMSGPADGVVSGEPRGAGSRPHAAPEATAPGSPIGSTAPEVAGAAGSETRSAAPGEVGRPDGEASGGAASSGAAGSSAPANGGADDTTGAGGSGEFQVD